jgi:hypothetical protein
MKKLRLDPEQLRVQSFPIQAPLPGRGTVAAHEGTVLHCGTEPYICGTVMRMSCASSCTDPEICGAF